MDGLTGPLERRMLTPAVLASVLFVAASAIFAITFVAGRGGLEMPVASRLPVAVATTEPVPTVEPATPGPVVTSAPTPIPTVAPTSIPTGPVPTLDPNDPLLALPACPDHPGCFMHVIQRFDTLSGVASRYLLSITVVLALNPEVQDPSLIVVGQTIYLGREPFARLDPCPEAPACSLYVVVPGDSLAVIAARYGLTTDQLRGQNPGMERPLVAGQVIELPHPA